MYKKQLVILFGVFFLLLVLIFYNKFLNKKEIVQKNLVQNEIDAYSSNIIKDVKYVSKDSKGNKYTIKALTGEIDYSDPML